jgi:hypothetical protein
MEQQEEGGGGHRVARKGGQQRRTCVVSSERSDGPALQNPTDPYAVSHMKIFAFDQIHACHKTVKCI